jgi:hypothetical protein
VKVYHGSTEVVVEPEIRPVTRPLDFGVGFYVSSIKERAEEWAVKKAKRHNSSAIVSTYELDMERLQSRYDFHSFAIAGDEWVDFVLAHRKVEAYMLQRSGDGKRMLAARAQVHHSYDAVMGEVADDDVFDAVELYESGILSREGLLERLKTKRVNDQICLCTSAALAVLKFVESYRVML